MPQTLRIVQLTDLHLLPPGEHLMRLDVTERFEAALTAAAATHPDAYLLTGDFCAQDPDPAIYEYLKPLLEALDAPYYLISGNHDSPAALRSVFDLPGRDNTPIYYRRTIGERPFLFLDTTRGYVDDEQLNWLAEQLRDSPDAEVVMHHPPLKVGVPFMDNKYAIRDNEVLLEVLTAHGPRRVFCGHYHSARHFRSGNLDVYVCPPTSFFINPFAEDFEQEFYPPAFRVLEWTQTDCFRYFDRLAL